MLCCLLVLSMIVRVMILNLGVTHHAVKSGHLSRWTVAQASGKLRNIRTEPTKRAVAV